jgi:hypothetical protein
MSAVNATLRSLAESCARAARGLVEGVATARRRGGDAHARAICPNDKWAFTPLYTDGACPLCGWEPEGYRYARPPLSRYDRYWGALGAIAAVSVAMLLVVLFALSNT